MVWLIVFHSCVSNSIEESQPSLTTGKTQANALALGVTGSKLGPAGSLLYTSTKTEDEKIAWQVGRISWKIERSAKPCLFKRHTAYITEKLPEPFYAASQHRIKHASMLYAMNSKVSPITSYVTSNTSISLMKAKNVSSLL